MSYVEETKFTALLAFVLGITNIIIGLFKTEGIAAITLIVIGFFLIFLGILAYQDAKAQEKREADGNERKL